MDGLKMIAAKQGANAIVGLDLDYSEFFGNRVVLIVNGTLVGRNAEATADVLWKAHENTDSSNTSGNTSRFAAKKESPQDAATS